MRFDECLLRDFVHSSYGFVNQDLARHYGVDDVVGIHFRKVNYPSESVRGGLLGQASILTLTANGGDTPVVGVLGFSKICLYSAAPPPPDVEPIDPDVRGAKTLQISEKHRTVEAVLTAMSRLTPMGFTEFFDPVGGYRPTYYKRRFGAMLRALHASSSSPVDGSAQLPSGNSLTPRLVLRKSCLLV